MVAPALLDVIHPISLSDPCLALQTRFNPGSAMSVLQQKQLRLSRRQAPPLHSQNSFPQHRPFFAPNKAGSPEGEPYKAVIMSLKELMIIFRRRLE